MSQLSSASVKDLLPENCFLNIDDDDEGTLNLVTTFTCSYLTHSAVENEGNSDSDGDSDPSSDVSSGECQSSDGPSRFIPFDIRPEDKLQEDEVKQFADRGCGFRLDDGNVMLSYCCTFQHVNYTEYLTARQSPNSPS